MPQKTQLKSKITLGIITEAAHLSFSQISRITIRAFYLIILARFLEPEFFGLFNYGMSWYLAFMSITHLGLDIIIGKHVRHNDKNTDIFISNTLKLQLAVTLLAALFCFISGFVFEPTQFSAILGFFSIALIGRSLSSWASFVLIAKEKSRKIFRLEFTCRLLEATFGTVILLNGGGLYEVVIIHALFWTVQAIWGLSILSASRLFKYPSNIKETIKSFGSAPVILGAATIFQVWLSQSPIILFRYLGGNDAQLGQIALAFQVFGLFAGISLVALRAVLPKLSDSVQKGRSGDTTFASWLISLTIIGTGFATSIYLISGHQFIEWIFGHQYIESANYIPFTLIAAASYTISVGAHQILAAHNNNLVIFTGTLIGSVITTISMFHIWETSNQFAPFISLAMGLLAWLVIVVVKIYFLTRFELTKTIFIPLILIVLALLIGHFIEPFSRLIAYLLIASIFLLWIKSVKHT